MMEGKGERLVQWMSRNEKIEKFARFAGSISLKWRIFTRFARCAVGKMIPCRGMSRIMMGEPIE